MGLANQAIGATVKNKPSLHEEALEGKAEIPAKAGKSKFLFCRH